MGEKSTAAGSRNSRLTLTLGMLLAMLLAVSAAPSPTGAATPAASVETGVSGGAITPAVAGASSTPQARKRARAKRRAQARKRAAARRKAQRRARAKRRARTAWPIKAPAGLRFYTPPRRMPAAHGRLIWQRPAAGLVPLKNASATRLVLYTSRSVTGRTVAVSGSVSFPKGKPPRGGWPVVTFGHSTTGIADKCAPSRNRAGGPVVEGVSYIDPVLNGWLAAGYAVARTDFQGLGTPGLHPYLVGRAAGRDMLDIVRATRQMGPKVSRRYLIAGHSQGGHGALFAAGIASRWTPELKLRGTVSYAPGSNLRTQAELLPALTQPNMITALAAMLFRGLGTAYPSLDPRQLLSDQVLPFYPATATECLDRLGRPDSLGGIAPSNLFRPGADLSGLYEVLDAQNPVVKTTEPILLLQGTADTSTFQFLTDSLNESLEGRGNRIDYRLYDGLDHWNLVDEAQPDVLAFFRARLPSGR